MSPPFDRLRQKGVTVGAIGLVAFGLTIVPALAQTAGSATGGAVTGGPGTEAVVPGNAIAPGAASGVGNTPIVGGGANGNGNVLPGTSGSGKATSTSSPNATEPQLKH